MASLTPIYIIHRSPAYGLGTCLVLVKNATAADTVTVADFDDVVGVTAIRLDTGAAITPTEATNIVTIPAGPSNTDIMLLVSGT